MCFPVVLLKVLRRKRLSKISESRRTKLRGQITKAHSPSLRSNNSTSGFTLESLGLTKDDSSYWQMLQAMEKRQGSFAYHRSHGATDVPPKLEDLGIKKTESSRWQQLSLMSEVEFKSHREGDEGTEGNLDGW